MGFRLVLKVVTLNDLEPRNGRCFASFYPKQWLSKPTTLNQLELYAYVCDNVSKIFGIIRFVVADARFFSIFSRKLTHPIFSLFDLCNTALPSQQ